MHLMRTLFTSLSWLPVKKTDESLVFLTELAVSGKTDQSLIYLTELDARGHPLI